MALSKADVEKYISRTEGRLNSPHERNLRGLAFADLYRKAGELELAKRYTLAYISTNSNDCRGHKILGELLEDGQDFHKALESYKRSFAINNNQNDVLLKIVKLYTDLRVDPKIAKAWADHASKRIPGHPAIFDLQVHLIELKNPLDYDELINLIAEELTQRPHDSSVHAKLVETYMAMDHVGDAYDHCVSVNKTKAFHNNLPWFLMTVAVLERNLNLKETEVNNHSPMSRQSILQEIYIALLTSYCNLVELNLAKSTLRKSSTSLLRLDQLLYQAINLDNGLSNSTDLSEASEWDVAITEIRAQLYMLGGHLLFRLAKEGYSAWSQALEMATACYVTSYRVSEPEMTSPWVAKASRERNPAMWSIMAASRLSQTGHLILATLDRYGEEKMNSILLNLCSPRGQEDILTTLYGHNNDFSKLFLSEDESFLTPKFIVPGQFMKYDEVFITENPLNLELIVWIGLHWYQHGENTEPGIEILVSQLFEGLRMDVHDVAQCSADFVCLRDIEAFIYAVIKCCAHEIFEDLDVVYEYYQPKLLPLCLCPSLCIPTQTDWWNAVYKFITGTVSVSSAGKVKMIVQRGLEQIRTLKNQGMHPKLVIHLATNFGQKSLLLKDAAGYSQWYYSTHWKSFQLRSLHYWNVVLSLLEDMKRNKNAGCPKDPLFPHKLSHLEDHDIHRYFREACMTLGEAAVEGGDFEHALNLFNRVESSHAAWNEAQIFKHLAGLESSNAGVDDRAYDSYIQYLNEAKERLLLCLHRLEYDKVVRDAVEEELATIESLRNERKSFYHVDPRKSIDFHQLDFEALKSPVCSDITESGETMPLKENDTRELLATVSEVTLDNGFLREQVSIRDEQVLRLSRQVQNLQSELARYQQNGEVSPEFSFPSDRTPSPEDYESPKVHLETGEKFTRQGTFVNNSVVPTDRCDDPSFFSGLSKSNTPDRIQSALDEGLEDEKEMDDIYFEPVVQLPSQVEFRSGEEDETVVFEERAKLFRFQDGEWKERGIGNLKLLWNSTTGQARIVMRREKVLKICANHFVTEDMALKACKGSDRSWVWSTLADIADDETKPQQFAVRFQTKEIAEKFKAKVEELQKKKASFVPESPAVSPFAANPLATKPTPDHMKVPVLTSNLPYLSSTPNKPAGTIQTASSVKTPSSDAIAGAGQNSGEVDSANFWNQPSVTSSMPYFRTFNDNSEEPSQAPHLGPEKSSLPQAGDPPPFQNTFSFPFGSKPDALENEKNTFAFNETSKNQDEIESGNGVVFDNASDKDLVSNNPFTLSTKSSFSDFGKPIFSEPDNDKEDENDIENEANIDFEPIVSLSLIKNQATGEEGELTRFSERAKLFRFDSASKEWKERGLGEIKLLYDPSSGKSRVVMRREQVHKLCANHFILPSMKLKANTTSSRSWLWYTHADVSDGEPKAEQLAVKFKQEETASEFKKVFEVLQSVSPSSKASDPDADEDTSTNMVVAPSSILQPHFQVDQDLKLQFQPPPDSWSCNTCLVQNSSQVTQCVACQAPRQGFSKQTPQPPFSFAPSSLKIAFEPAEGSWECDTCLVRNAPESNVCAACQTPKPGTQPTTTNSGFNFSTSTSSGFCFGPSDASKDSTQGSGFSFGASDPSKDTTQGSGFSFAASGPSKDTTQGSGFSFAASDPSKDTTQGSGFSFAASDLSKDTTQGSGFSFGASDPSKDTTQGSGFSFAGSDPSKDTTQGSGFSFGASDPSKDTTQGSGFSFTASDASKDTTQGSGFSFAASDPSKDTTQGSGFRFGASDASKDTTQTNGFSFAASDPSKDTTQGSGFSFGASDASKDTTQTNGFSFGASDAGKDTTQSSGFTLNPNTKSNYVNKEPRSSSADTIDGVASKDIFSDDDDTDSDETTDSEASEDYSSNSHSAKTSGKENDSTGFTFQDQSSATGNDTSEAEQTKLDSNSFSFSFPNTKGDSLSSSAESNVIPTQGFTFGKSFSSEFRFGSTPQTKDSDNTVPTSDGTKGQNCKPVFRTDNSSDSSKGFSFTDASKGFSFGDASKGFSVGSLAGTGFNFGEVQTSQSRFNTSGDGKDMKSTDMSIVPTTGDPKELPKHEDNLLTHGAFTFRLNMPEKPTVTSPGKKDLNVSEENPEVEDERVVFKPIVSLPSQVDVKTGEEDETTLFSNHAKLYRFTQSTWKERGVGEMKVLYDSNRKRGRVIMRRDQVHTLCANHFIHENMKLHPQGSSGKSWFWHAQGDYAENEVKEEVFAVKFKDTDSALAFQRAFKQCNEVNSLQEDVEDSVIVVYELLVTDDQRDRAAKFLLPPNFYAKQSEVDPEENQKTLSDVPAASEPTPFIFGSADVTSLSFNALASGFGSSHTFGKSSPNKEFTGAGAQLFAQENNQQDDDPEREVSGIDFKPIVQLEQIERSSGEENETVIYQQRAKLYRYDKDTSQWKERGVGNLKLLKHKITGQIRVLMRREQILKVCANHLLTPDMELKTNAGSDRSWLWHTNADISDGEAKPEQLAVKFKNAEIAQEFKEKFDECKDELASCSQVSESEAASFSRLDDIDEPSFNVDVTAGIMSLDRKTQETSNTSASVNDYSTTDYTGFLRSVGTNDTENNASEIFEDEPSKVLQSHDELSSYSSSLDNEQDEASIDSERQHLAAKPKTLPLNTSSKTPPEQGFSSNQRKTRPSSFSARSTPREILNSIDEPSPSCEPFMRVNFNFHSIVAAKAIYTGLDEETVNPPEIVESENKVAKELFPDTNITEEEYALEKKDKEPESGSAAVDGGNPVFSFGSSDISTLTFASLANQSCGFTSQPSQTKGFLGSGGQLFTSSDEDDPEREVEGADFKPIVSLPDVIKQETGEENEIVVYTHRAKLFRYDLDTKQWKERGVGDIKILRHNETKRCRVVMRRDQIHKLCANHYITAAMELKENEGSDRSWVWSVDADFADGVAKNELFAVRFKLREDAEMFRDKFVECQNFEESPSDDDDEVEIIFQRIPSLEQKKRAQAYLLPQTFYCFEQDSGKVVEETCSQDLAPEAFTQLQKSVSERDEDRPEIEDNIPVFQFGSKQTSALSFSELAQQASGFPTKSDGQWKGFLGSGGQLFTSNDEDDPEREVEGADFKPIVSLPDVIKQETGEENEIVVYTHRAKLFRYDLDTKQWKERGVGDIKILRHNETKRCRVVMRRDQIHKLCANHYITAAMELKENQGSDRSWVWSVDADFADGVAKNELFAVRFKLREDAEMFRDKFVECQNFKEKTSDDDNEVEITFERIPSSEENERAQAYLLPQTFYCFEQYSGKEVEETCSQDIAPNLFTQLQQSVPENEENIPVFQFGSKQTSALSFSELAQQASGFPAKSDGQWKGFVGSGGQLFTLNDEDDPEREVEGADFKPIVSLPDVIKQETGEENEIVVYSHRAKLYRYDLDTKQWKERGVGDIKILRHNETKRCRVVMRRDQIHKLCANHYITAAMELKENEGSDRSWVWSVDADFADGVAKNELFAVRFKRLEDAEMFRDKFVECQDKNVIKPTEVSSFEEKPSDDDDEVEIIFEKIPSPEQKEKAQAYLLPETFYCFEQDSEKVASSDDNDTPDTQKSVLERDVSEIEDNIPVFQFGSKQTSALSFSELAQQASGFPTKSDGQWKGFLGSGGQLFTSNDEDDPEREVEGADFKPIVSLPDVIKQETGEENEIVVYTHRAKLYRYDLDTKQWKERGVGDIKILRHNETKRGRVVMRRDQIHKLCANHYITAAMELKENERSDRSWVWSVDADFADGVAKNELFAVRFKLREDAEMFRDKFIECQEKNEIKPFEVSSFEEKPSNDDDKVEVIFEKIPSPEQKEKARLHQLPQTFFCSEETAGDTFVENEKEQYTGVSSELFQDKEEGQRKSDEKSSVQSQGVISLRERRPDETKYKLNVVDESPSSVPGNNFPTLQDSAFTTTYAHSFVFGSQDISSLSFSALAGTSSGFKSSPNKEFTGAGVQLFAQENNQQDDDPEREVSGIDFKPIVQLEQIERSSGEENETVIYQQRAKLYRYDKDTSQWKERGVGNLKLLKHKITGQIRVLMRREQILKICANHLLTPDKELKTNAGSDRSWLWHTNADISDGEAKPEQLAVKFKNAEIAQEFKEKFDECRDELKPSQSEMNNFEREDDKNESVYETMPGAFTLTANNLGDSTNTSTLNVSLKQEKLVLPVTEKCQSNSVVRVKNVTEEPGAMQKSKENEKFSVRLSRETRHVLSSTFYTDYLPRLKKQNLESNVDVQVLFDREAQVYHFDERQGDWREKGYGVLQILRYDSEFHIFLLDQDRICVAHQITPSMDLKPNAGSDRSWVWFTLADHSDFKVFERELAAEFQSVEHSFEFKKIFDQCRDSCGVPHEGHVHAMAASFDSNTHKLPSHHGVSPLKVESALWRGCSSCKVENSVENTSCLVCGKHFTADDRPVVKPMRKYEIKVTSSSGRKKPVATPKHVVATTSTVEKYKPVNEWWKCPTCGVENNVKNTLCHVCSSLKPPKMLKSNIISCSPEITKMLDEISKK